ncbi:hypothetical protein D9756_002873 [Leucocoprinus leucothites]|uniref:Uncharacterized protein n=1 Tax=Leucocoprinus leucothites TaxID=201217 RepID=A0A8H5LJP1_9AGAR|nr:hypothetical protein D9756_002873 [Leucoagaricus leucothites]
MLLFTLLLSFVLLSCSATPVAPSTKSSLSTRAVLKRAPLVNFDTHRTGLTYVVTGSRQDCWEQCVGDDGVDADYCEEICRDHRHRHDDDGGGWVMTISTQDHPKRTRLGRYIDESCWEECIGGEGGDADYCEEICQDQPGEADGGANTLIKVEIASAQSTFRSERDPGSGEDACWEDCTNKEGANSDYCEEVCRNHEHGDKSGPNGDDEDVEAKKSPLQPVSQRDGDKDEDACWEDCTNKEGADADYCEEICRNHDHGDSDDSSDGDSGRDSRAITSPEFQSGLRGAQDADDNDGEDACWEDCTGQEGADADYCEEICRNHDHGDGEEEDDDVDEPELRLVGQVLSSASPQRWLLGI